MAIPTRLALGISMLLVGGIAMYVQVTSPPPDQSLPSVTLAPALPVPKTSAVSDDDAAPTAPAAKPTFHLAAGG